LFSDELNSFTICCEKTLSTPLDMEAFQSDPVTYRGILSCRSGAKKLRSLLGFIRKRREEAAGPCNTCDVIV
jgi:hypothetical protein